jgi:hypothetical protein
VQNIASTDFCRSRGCQVDWRGFIPIFMAYWCTSMSAMAQEVLPSGSLSPLPASVGYTETFEKTVIPIIVFTSAGPGIRSKFGTGFCLDPRCRFIGTNYHVAKMAQPRKIEGERVVERYLATGPDDRGATINDLSIETVDFLPRRQHSMKFTPSRDLAIFEMRHPLRHYHGVAFSLHELREGQEVDIYAYPKETINPVRTLLRFHGAFTGETTTGLLAFDYSLNADRGIRPGASGGIVVDRKTRQIVGILTGIAKSSETIALAVPIQSLAEFVIRVQPSLAQTIFPSAQGISALSTDFYPKYVLTSASVFQRRPDEPPEVKMLRSKAQILADSMRNFIAVQTLAWGSGVREPAAEAAYEIRIIDGSEQFRLYPDGKKELRDMSFPPLRSPIVPGSEWSDLPRMVGTEPRLKIHQAADAFVNERRMQVFQYAADVEDAACTFRDVLDFVVFKVNKYYTVACYGEVWTDKDANIGRISVHYEFPGKFGEYRSVVTYGWLNRQDEASVLIPLTLSSEFENKKHIDWCRSQFMNYQMFSAQVRIIADQPARNLSVTSQ